MKKTTSHFAMISKSRKEIEVLNIDVIKHFLKIDGDEDNDLLKNHLICAIEAAEYYTGIKILPEVFEVTYQNIFRETVIFPHYPINKVLSVSITNYGRSKELKENVWVASHDQLRFSIPIYADYMTIVYECGYEDASKIPNLMKQGILKHVEGLYYHNPNAFKIAAEYYQSFIKLKV